MIPLLYHHKGASVLELLITLAIVTTLATLSWTSLTQFFNTHTVDKEASVLIATIAYTRSQSMSGRNDTSYGIHFASTTATIFTGGTYTAGASSNVVRTFSSSAQISSISLTAGVSDIIFAKLTGTPSATGTITVSSSKDSTKKRIVTISGTGLVE